MDKKGIVTHPGTWAAAAFLLGVVFMALLCRGTIEIGGLGSFLCG